MRKSILFGVVFLIASCTVYKEEEFENPIQRRYHAVAEEPVDAETRVFTDSKLRVRWNEGDHISIFERNTYNQEFEFLGDTGDTAGDFDPVESSGYHSSGDIEDGHVYAVYPYEKKNKCDFDGKLTVTFPSTQHYKKDSFGVGANVMVAKTNTMDLRFMHVGGYRTFKLYGEGVTVSSVRIESNGPEYLAGRTDVTIGEDGKPAVSFIVSSSNSKSVELVCDTPVALGATDAEAVEFWFVLPPGTLTQGFTVTVTDENSNEFTKSTSNSIEVKSGVKKSMPAFEVEIESGRLPVVGDVNILSIGYDKASVQSSLVSDGNTTTEYGFYYGSSVESMTNQVVASERTSENTPGVFSAEIVNLNSGTTYYVKSYATNEIGTVESEVVSFTTTSLAYYENGHLCGSGIPIVQKVGSIEKTVIWAPVNLGYYDTSNNKYTYGRLYQWGRIAGQGYAMNMITTTSGDRYTYTDENGKTVHSKVNTALPLTTPDPNTHYMWSEYQAWDDDNEQYYVDSNDDWYGSMEHSLMGSSGSWNDIEKDGYIGNPCPHGWRVPSFAELCGLVENKSSFTTVNNQNGYYFYGLNSNGNRVFFPAGGQGGPNPSQQRGTYGTYWSCNGHWGVTEGGEEWHYYNDALYITFTSSNVNTTRLVYPWEGDPWEEVLWGGRCRAQSIRCVKE